MKFWEIERDFNKLLISFETNPLDFVEETMQVDNSAQKLANILTITRWIANKLPKLSNIDTKPFEKSHSLNYEKQMKHKKKRDWDDEHYKAIEEYCDISLKNQNFKTRIYFLVNKWSMLYLILKF